MKFILSIFLFCAWPFVYSQSACTGAFPNPVTDVCYDCMFPIVLAGVPLSFGTSSSDYDTGVGRQPVCACSNLTVGTPIGFWEPRYMVDVTNKPGCMPLLGGVDIKPPYNDMEYGATTKTQGHLDSGGSNKASFQHVNEYVNPVMTALGILAQSPCMDSRSFDVPFVSWADPTWGDDSLALCLTPYAFPFAGLPSVAAEAPDAIAATLGFPLPELFWVAGAWGPMYPLTGNVSVAKTPEQVSHLLLARMFAKLHAAGVQQSPAGRDALNSCGAFGFPQLVMDKRQYKTSRTWPWLDNVCTPIGRPLPFQEAGAAGPAHKDYGYFVFQRKDCCQPLPVGPSQ